MKTIEEIEGLLIEYGASREINEWERAKALRGQIMKEIRELSKYKVERRRVWPKNRRMVTDRRQS